MGKIELLWKFTLQGESATIMHLLIALAHIKRFDVRGNNKHEGNDSRSGVGNISQMLFRVSSD